jgi:hypothetical protein
MSSSGLNLETRIQALRYLVDIIQNQGYRLSIEQTAFTPVGIRAVCIGSKVRKDELKLYIPFETTSQV